MGHEHPESVKAACIAALLAGQGIDAVAKEYNLPRGTVHGWRVRAMPHLRGAAAKKGERIGQLVTDYLEAALQALKNQAETFADQEWLKTKDLHDVAILHGILADKGVRILEALDRQTEDEAAPG